MNPESTAQVAVHGIVDAVRVHVTARPRVGLVQHDVVLAIEAPRPQPDLRRRCRRPRLSSARPSGYPGTLPPACIFAHELAAGSADAANRRAPANEREARVAATTIDEHARRYLRPVSRPGSSRSSRSRSRRSVWSPSPAPGGGSRSRPIDLALLLVPVHRPGPRHHDRVPPLLHAQELRDVDRGCAPCSRSSAR